MKILNFIFFISLIGLSACSKYHGDLYIYNSRVYSTNVVSDFEMDHFKAKGRDQVVIVDNFKSEESLKVAQENCKNMELQCQTIKMDNFDEADRAAVRAAIASLENQKFMLISEKPEATAFFVGTYSQTYFNGGESEINKILSDLKLAENTQLKSKILQ